MELILYSIYSREAHEAQMIHITEGEVKTQKEAKYENSDAHYYNPLSYLITHLILMPVFALSDVH